MNEHFSGRGVSLLDGAVIGVGLWVWAVSLAGAAYLAVKLLQRVIR